MAPMTSVTPSLVSRLSPLTRRCLPGVAQVHSTGWSHRWSSSSSSWSGDSDKALLQRASGLTLSSWFKLEELGMQGYELLSRASCFLVHAKHRTDRRLLLLGAAHVSFPSRFPQYYPRDQYQWLDKVEPRHTRHLLELRNDTTGDVMEVHRLQDMVCHDTRDLVAGQLKDEPAFLSSYADLYEEKDPTLVLSSDAPDYLTDKEVFMVGCAVDDAGLEDETTVSQNTAGVVRVVTQDRIFAATEETLSMGICGGPVLAKNQLVEGAESQTAVVGMLEGVVTSINEGVDDSKRDVLKVLEGNAAIIPGHVLIDFRDSYLPE